MKELTEDQEAKLVIEALALISQREAAKEYLADNLTVSKETYGEAANNITKDAEAIYKAQRDRAKYDAAKAIKEREYQVVTKKLG